MEFPVFSVRDLKVGFGFPFVSQSEPYAVRDFLRQLSQNDSMSFSPADFQLYKIGNFNTDTALIEVCTPQLLVDGGSSNARS